MLIFTINKIYTSMTKTQRRVYNSLDTLDEVASDEKPVKMIFKHKTLVGTTTLTNRKGSAP